MQQKPATELIKNAQLNILPGGHMYHIEYPYIFAQTVTEFLEKKAYFQTA